MRTQLLLFISWIFQLLLVSLPVASGLEEIPFWDDSAFDDILRSDRNFSSVKLLIHVSADECGRSCERDNNCISLFYHARDMRCEKMYTNLVLNAKVDDPRIKFYRDNRYYRYLPKTGNCPMERCFYYNKAARACWKVLFKKGPRSGGLYNYEDAKKACRDEGAEIISIDTKTKFIQLNFRLENIAYSRLIPANDYSQRRCVNCQ